MFGPHSTTLDSFSRATTRLVWTFTTTTESKQLDYAHLTLLLLWRLAVAASPDGATLPLPRRSPRKAVPESPSVDGQSLQCRRCESFSAASPDLSRQVPAAPLGACHCMVVSSGASKTSVPGAGGFAHEDSNWQGRAQEGF